MQNRFCVKNILTLFLRDLPLNIFKEIWGEIGKNQTFLRRNEEFWENGKWGELRDPGVVYEGKWLSDNT